VNIDVFQQEQDRGLYGGREIWVRVQGDELLDLPRVLEQLDEEQRKELTLLTGRTLPQPIAYHPALVEGGDNNPYKYEDWWIFGRESSSDAMSAFLQRAWGVVT